MGSRASAGGTAEALSHAPVDGEKLSHGLYHEKQLRSLCAVHCMNNLVQGPYFDEVYLVEVAHGLDAQKRVALGGAWLEGQASGNAREDGFSVQVIQEALSRQGLSCIPISAESARGALTEPCTEKGFILNRNEHWFALRRLGSFWFDFNSTQPVPELLSKTELSNFLEEKVRLGYSIFPVRGNYPPADIETRPRDLQAAVDACRAHYCALGHIQCEITPSAAGFAQSAAGYAQSPAGYAQSDAEYVQSAAVFAQCDDDLTAPLLAYGDCPPAITSDVKPALFSFDSRVLSTILFIAGTTIGGGTLSLPAAASAPGFVPAAGALMTCSLVLFLESCLMVEVTVRMKAEGSAREGEPVSFQQMAERTLGKIGGTVIGLVYQSYSYAAILAYCAGIGDVVSLLVKGALTIAQGQVVAVFGIWVVILLMGKKGISNVNEKLNYVFLTLMALIIFVGLGQANLTELLGTSHWMKTPNAAGILLFNLVFHDVLPLVCHSLDYDVRKINTACFFGALIPLCACLMYMAAALGDASGSTFVDPIMHIMQSGTAQGKVVQVWALLAIGTSFIGCGMAQAEYEASLMRQFMAPRWKNFTSEFGKKFKSLWDKYLLDQLAFASVLLPPLAVSLIFLALGQSGMAYKAADLAGAFGVSILYGILPPVMTFILRSQQAAKKPEKAVPTTPGGPLLLFGLFLFGVTVTVREALTYIV
eukprot:CAMPEP_0198204212 /NCGR_PEP_ID=MMETSP1445-20131203/7599_1 /TAXON_ID=36898 /ORGANISM="Pyramimonas sp., Strain CCMP2087" /LENGTH=703 /DNA_ID=CAMNT_0043875981 /DNA_START=116 /DNA_END=2227 /DNA_ORIENTATION=-